MFLYQIEVEAAFRRRGVGGTLVRWLIAYCRRRQFEEVFVFTDPSNAPAVGLYRSTGAVTETPADRMFVYQLERGTGSGARPKALAGDAARRPRRTLPARTGAVRAIAVTTK